MSHSRSVDDPFLAAKCWTQIISKLNHEKIKFGSAEVDGMQFIFYPLGYRDSTEVRSQPDFRCSASELRAAPGCSGLLPRAFVPSFCTVPRVCATAPHQLGGFGGEIRSHEFIVRLFGYCEPTSTYDSYDHKGAHFVMPRGEHQVQLERGQPKRDVDALRSLSWRQSSAKFLEASRMRAGEVTVKLSLQGSWNPLRE